MTIRAAAEHDLERLLDLAEAKRAAYADHASPFQRPAAGARRLQGPFFRDLLRADDSMFIAHERDGEIKGFVIGRVATMPPPFGRPGFHVDDFVVASSDLWPTTGAALLRAAAAAAGSERDVVVVAGPHDRQKTEMIRGLGLVAEADWWVKPLPGRVGPAVDQPAGVHAMIAAAPPVYDPGGPVALALAPEGPRELAGLERWAASSGAVLAIVPARRGDEPLSRCAPPWSREGTPSRRSGTRGA